MTEDEMAGWPKYWSFRFSISPCNEYSGPILKEINPGISLEGMILKLKLQYFGHLIRRVGKDSDAGMDWGHEEKGTMEDEMAGCITD